MDLANATATVTDETFSRCRGEQDEVEKVDRYGFDGNINGMLLEVDEAVSEEDDEGTIHDNHPPAFVNSTANGIIAIKLSVQVQR